MKSWLSRSPGSPRAVRASSSRSSGSSISMEGPAIPSDCPTRWPNSHRRYEAAGNETKALATYEQLLERTPEDETTRRKYLRLRAKMGLEPMSGEMPQPVKLAPTEVKVYTRGAPIPPNRRSKKKRSVTLRKPSRTSIFFPVMD